MRILRIVYGLFALRHPLLSASAAAPFRGPSAAGSPLVYEAGHSELPARLAFHSVDEPSRLPRRALSLPQQSRWKLRISEDFSPTLRTLLFHGLEGLSPRLPLLLDLIQL